MTEHKLVAGRVMIDGLIRLGRALGYEIQEEWAIEPGTAAIDVAWLRGSGDDVPLLAFEIETTPGQGLASNAVKILGKDSSSLRKPLHLFHVVVHGGEGSGRPTDVGSVFSSHNYSIHLMSASGEPKTLLREVLAVHRRVSDHISGFAFAKALIGSPWPTAWVDEILSSAERSGFRGLTEASYTRLALEQPEDFLPSLARRLTSLWQPQLIGESAPPDRFLEPEQPREEEYGSYMASAAAEAIELGLIATLRPDLDLRAFELLCRWQALNHIGDMPGPFTGAGTQWTEYIVENIGYLWALVAVLMRNVQGARRWCAEQPASLLNYFADSDAPEILLLAGWVMHVAAAPDTADIYERARKRVERGGGLSQRWFARPESSAPGRDGDWSFALSEPLTAPSRTELQLLTRGAQPATDAIQLALDALVEDPGLRPRDGAALAVLLAA
jgi:hypothetical protein